LKSKDKQKACFTEEAAEVRAYFNFNSVSDAASRTGDSPFGLTASLTPGKSSSSLSSSSGQRVCFSRFSNRWKCEAESKGDPDASVPL
jgi:hypothetical protein